MLLSLLLIKCSNFAEVFECHLLDIVSQVGLTCLLVDFAIVELDVPTIGCCDQEHVRVALDIVNRYALVLGNGVILGSEDKHWRINVRDESITGDATIEGVPTLVT